MDCAVISPRAEAEFELPQDACVSEPDSTIDWVGALEREALQHRAVRHPYLEALANGTLPDGRWALIDFARNYHGYSIAFPRYLTTVISRLEDADAREMLLDNLNEESGHYSEADYQELAAIGVKRCWIEGIAHPDLFRQFCRALGADVARWTEQPEVVMWRERFLGVLAHGTPSEALGALGLGTETIVRAIYGPFVQAIARLDLSAHDTVFFPLHTAVDDNHQATLKAISADVARSQEGRRDLRRGMLQALALRADFWDWLDGRALVPLVAEAGT